MTRFEKQVAEIRTNAKRSCEVEESEELMFFVVEAVLLLAEQVHRLAAVEESRLP